jgi:two-component system, LytTR family, response regulator
MERLRLLIVDDEVLIRSSIRGGIASRSDIEIVGECESCAQAVESICSLQPDLVLLDIQMHDGTGLDVVRLVGPQRMPEVIFITAYDEYAVKAFELNALDYLLKPFDDERLHHSIDRARRQIAAVRAGGLVERLQQLLSTPSPAMPERLVVRNGDQFDLVPVESIDWIESANNYVQIHCRSRRYLHAETLTSLAGRLNPHKFMRIHRGRVVNVSRIVSIHPLFNGTYEVELSDGSRLATGKSYREQIAQLLRNSS